MLRRQYALEQEKFLQENPIGTRVFITRESLPGERGWANSFVPIMRRRIGGYATIAGAHPTAGVVLDDRYCYPFFVLKPEERPEVERSFRGIKESDCFILEGE